MNNRYRKDIGDYGEKLAEGALLKKGYEIIAKKYTIKGGEIDLIAKKNNTLVFVEVKTLPHGSVDTLNLVFSYKKKLAVSKTARVFLEHNRQYSDCLKRFDAIIIDLPGMPQVVHIKDAFQSCGGY